MKYALAIIEHDHNNSEDENHENLLRISKSLECTKRSTATINAGAYIFSLKSELACLGRLLVAAEESNLAVRVLFLDDEQYKSFFTSEPNSTLVLSKVATDLMSKAKDEFKDI